VAGTEKQLRDRDADLSTSFMHTNHSNSMIPRLHVQKVKLASYRTKARDGETNTGNVPL